MPKTPDFVGTNPYGASDVETAIDYSAREGGTEVALGFIDALQAAYALIASHPESGSLRYEYELGLPDLRSVSMKRCPYLIFYRDQPVHVDVWRVLHAERDIPQWMQEPNNH
ncbi:type II toxin-antitoxin system RelE/ParE family toxin [Ensifer sp. IC4062]|nr:type II toxin-antitoxin system RelE/ParE family toxin [Ensifer sp. IC4062]MCA1444042.1 type II toxin-antitoxin system RelE/ParE family toxin [Ensifer sp. IC4062]